MNIFRAVRGTLRKLVSAIKYRYSRTTPYCGVRAGDMLRLRSQTTAPLRHVTPQYFLTFHVGWKKIQRHKVKWNLVKDPSIFPYRCWDTTPSAPPQIEYSTAFLHTDLLSTPPSPSFPDPQLIVLQVRPSMFHPYLIAHLVGTNSTVIVENHEVLYFYIVSHAEKKRDLRWRKRWREMRGGIELLDDTPPCPVEQNPPEEVRIDIAAHPLAEGTDYLPLTPPRMDDRAGWSRMMMMGSPWWPELTGMSMEPTPEEVNSSRPRVRHPIYDLDMPSTTDMPTTTTVTVGGTRFTAPGTPLYIATPMDVGNLGE